MIERKWIHIDCIVTYKLPDITIIGGETQSVVIKVQTESGTIIDATTLRSEFAIYPYGFENNSPLFSTQGGSYEDSEGKKVLFTINAKDTVSLSGKFLYQVSLVSEQQEVEIYQGLLTIKNNISKEFVLVTNG